MNKASSVYVVMTLIFVAGIWMILSIGSRLRAPKDLSRNWELSPADGQRADGG